MVESDDLSGVADDRIGYAGRAGVSPAEQHRAHRGPWGTQAGSVAAGQREGMDWGHTLGDSPFADDILWASGEVDVRNDWHRGFLDGCRCGGSQQGRRV